VPPASLEQAGERGQPTVAEHALDQRPAGGVELE
jgi:hypothetical protein